MRIHLTLAALLLSFSHALQADDPIVPPEPPRILNKIPLKVEIPESVRASLSPAQVALLETLTAKMADEVFLWSGFEVPMPRPILSESPHLIELSPFFTVDPQTHVKKQATDAEGNRIALNSTQWHQLAQDSLFAVPVPGTEQFDVWTVTTSILHKGDTAIKISLEKHLAEGLKHMTVGLPQALLGSDGISIKRAVKNILYGLRNSLSLLGGLSEKTPSYTAEQIDQLVTERRALFVAKGLQEAAAAARPPQNVDLRLDDDLLMGKAIPILTQLSELNDQQWPEHEPEARREIETDLRRHGRFNARWPQLIADRLEEKKQAAFLERVKTSAEIEALDPKPGFAALLARHGEALFLTAQTEARLQRDLKEYEQRVRKQICDAHRIRCHIASWLDAQVSQRVQEYYLQIRHVTYKNLVDRLYERGLIQQSKALQLNLEFFERNEEEIREDLAAAEQGTRLPKRYHRIWSSRNWIVTETPKGYQAQVHQPMPDVYTDEVGWRIVTLWQKTLSAFKGGLFKLVYENWWNGPVGIKSLLLAEPFPSAYMVDPQTGKIIPEAGSKTQTLVSRISAHIQKTVESRERFEAAEDAHFFTKGFKRPFHWFWHAFIRRYSYPLALIPTQLAATATNTAATAAGVAASPVWAPMAGLFSHGWNAAIYDFDAPRPSGGFASVEEPNTTGKFLPLASQLLCRCGLSGALPGSLALARATAWEPSATAVQWLGGFARWWGEMGRDMLARALFKVGGGNIPATNTGWLFRRTHGPGVEKGFVYEVDHSSALMGVLIQAELHRLNIWEKEIEALLNAPEESAKEFLAPIAVLVSGSADTGLLAKGPVLSPMLEFKQNTLEPIKKALDERRRTLLKLIPSRPTAPIRMSIDEFEHVVNQGTGILRKLFSGESSLPPEQHRAAIWDSLGLAEGDWARMVQSFLSASFGGEVLSPLDSKDKSLFRVKVEAPQILSMVTAALQDSDLTLAETPEGDWAFAQTKPVSPIATAIGGAHYCANALGTYGSGMNATQVLAETVGTTPAKSPDSD